jgi:hypothetical protein
LRGCRACRGLNRFWGRCYDLWGVCRLYRAYRACGARFWFWARFWLRLWAYGSHRLNRYRLRARLDRSDNTLSSFDILGSFNISAHILCAVNLLSFRYRAWADFRLRRRINRGRSTITRVVKQSRVQLSAITRYNANKAGEVTSKATLAKVLGNVAFIQEVVVFIVPSNRKVLSVANRVLAGNDSPSLLSVGRGRLPDHKEKKKAHKYHS